MIRANWPMKNTTRWRTGIGLVAIAAAFGWLSLPGGLRSPKSMTVADLGEVSLSTLAGRPVALAELAAGRPMVVNLWATWCPPCRREMPLLAAAQRREPGVVFVFADQGEDRSEIQAYLESEKLEPAHVVRDARRALGQHAGTSALPVTLFFAADGRLVHSRIGEISEAALATQFDKLRPPPPASAPDARRAQP